MQGLYNQLVNSNSGFGSLLGLQSILPSLDKVSPVYDVRKQYEVRLICVRHAERIDQVLGEKWYDIIFGGQVAAPLHKYEHPQLPRKLPYRTLTASYVFDPPISRNGENTAMQLGARLSHRRVKVDYCYSSPASRSVITAAAILAGMHSSSVPIRIDNALFEPMNWNKPLEQVKDMGMFLTPTNWQQSYYNVDVNYPQVVKHLDTSKDEIDYYNRSKRFLKYIFDHHVNQKSRQKPITILVVGHSGTPEIFPQIAAKEDFDVEKFIKRTNQNSYLHTSVFQYELPQRKWHFLRQI